VEVRKAPRCVFRASAHDRFNCEEVWGRSGDRMDGVSDPLLRARESRTSQGLLTEEAFASTRQYHRAA
jgi:hypothetical protein